MVVDAAARAPEPFTGPVEEQPGVETAVAIVDAGVPAARREIGQVPGRDQPAKISLRLQIREVREDAETL